MTDKKPLDRFTATYTVDLGAHGVHGPLYYIALDGREQGPYLRQKHVSAILDIAADGTLAGIELIDNMPGAPAGRVLARPLEERKG